MNWNTYFGYRYVGVALALLLAPLAISAQPGTTGGWGTGPCPQGPGMMGPGMMGGMGTMGGMGMMGGGGMMGPGMMGGQGGMGMGPGMSGGMGMMGGMGMGMGPFAMLDLTDEQRTKIAKIQEDVRKRHWNTQGKILDEQARLSELYAAEKPDSKQVGQAYSNMAKLQQEVIEANVQAQNQMLDVLTKEQREQLSQMRRGVWGQGPMGGRGYGPGRGMGPGMMQPGTPPAGGAPSGPQ
jgi:Spy/CpxP family protein refolding chaperone